MESGCFGTYSTRIELEAFGSGGWLPDFATRTSPADNVKNSRLNPFVTMDPHVVLDDIFTGFVLPFAMRAVFKLGVADVLAEGREKPMSITEIASHLPCKAPADGYDLLKRLLSSLTTRGIFSEALITSTDGKLETAFSLTPVSRLLVKGQNMHPGAVGLQASLIPAFLNLHEAILSNRTPWVVGHGINFYEFLATHLDDLEGFQQTQTAHSRMWVNSFLKSYDRFKDASTLVDIGGGHGTALSAIVAAHPHLLGISFDLPQVIATAPSITGIKFVAGSYLEPGYPSGDILLLKRILHNNDDETCLKILKNCFEALQSGRGKLLVVELVLTPTTSSPKKEHFHAMDLSMMAFFQGARERTLEQFETLLLTAGFSRYSLISSEYDLDVIEVWKD